ncbi:MAG: adenylyl-sulfate kinase [Hyphomicrobiaceae bacterium]|nr:adenylyl-sulfate kinase [Hyphomicrobiaceae bacterium]
MSDRGMLRILTCGAVDDGKSTLVGRLLFETGHILDDEMAALERDSRIYGTVAGEIDFALAVDGLVIEREQSITIDVAHRYFSTSRRSFIVADAPGHEQYTRNMATGASKADLAIIVIDARKGVVEQTERHANICHLMGIRHVVLAISKIDLVEDAQSAFRKIAETFVLSAEPLGFASLQPIPVSGVTGDNVTTRSGRTPWYTGPTLLEHLEQIDAATDTKALPFRFPVQRVVRPNQDFRGYAGTIASGIVHVGDAIVSALSGRPSRISRIVTADGDLQMASIGDAVTLGLSDEIDVARGDLLVPATERPEISDQFAAQLIWMDETHLLPGRSYVLRIGNRWVPASITAIKHRIDIHTRQHLAARNLELNEIGVCNLATALPIAFDAYAENRETGSFILVDRISNHTVAAGLISFGLRRATNIHVEELFVDKAARSSAKHQRATVIWFTGLSGSGKSTIAKRLEKRLHDSGNHTYVLDGDNVRHGLNHDLGFTDTDRVENIRRIGEVSKLFADAGLIVMCSFISPFRAERRMVRELLEDGEFIEVFVDASLAECQRRDPKGLYAKALAGKVKNFTGIDSPYEPPEQADIHLVTENVEPDALVDQIMAHLREKGRI